MKARDLPRLDLHYEAVTPSGRCYRWGKDEPRPENVPSGGGFSTSIPGGFDTMRVNLPRKAEDYKDLERLTTLRALGASVDLASEVRLQAAPRTSGDQFAVGPEAVGWRAHLEDDTSAAEIYRDKDLNSWGDTSRDRAENRKKAQRLDGVTSVLTDMASGIPAVVIAIEKVFNNGFGEALYASGNIPLGSVYYDYSSQGIGSDWTVGLEMHDDDSWASEYNATADLNTGPTTGTLVATAGTERTAIVISGAYTGGAGPFESPGTLYFRRLAVEGTHGLTKQGTEPEAGLLASDVIAHALSRWAPLLSFTQGSTGTIRPSSFVIPHLVFKDKTTAQAIVEGANRYELRPFAVWEGPNPRKVEPTFYYHDWGDRGRTWRGRVAQSQMADTGPSVDRLRNGVIVAWSDVDGTARTAGPIGSGCDVEDAALEDRDPENPANQRGLKMYGPPLPMEGVSVSSEAIRVGALLLERLKQADSSGQAMLVGVVEDDRAVIHPAWRARAGDYFEPIDASDRRPRRIIRTDYDEQSLTNTITLDAPPDEPEDLLAQLGVSVADLGV